MSRPPADTNYEMNKAHYSARNGDGCQTSQGDAFNRLHNGSAPTPLHEYDGLPSCYSRLETPTAQPETVGVPVKEPASGFVLISVKHLSRVPKSKQRAASKSDPRNKHIPVRRHTESSFNYAGWESSQSSMAEDDSIHGDLYGSGSVEAEEFEDDEPDDDDDDCGIMLSHETLVATLPGKQLPRVLSDNKLEVNNSQDVLSEQIKASLNVMNSLSSGVDAQALLHPPTCGPSLGPLLNGYMKHVPTPHGMFSPITDTNVEMTAPLQGNNSHNPKLDSALPETSKSSKTPATTSHTSSSQFNYLHSVSPSSIHVAAIEVVQDHPAPVAYRTPYGHPRIACVHHLHTPGHSDSGPTETMPVTDANQLAPSVEAAISVASLPPLQPASRFRKARIHETVEQWSHGRASVHDCRIKTIPGWVSELTKKTHTLEQNLAAALEQKFNCMSCLEMKTLDHTHSRPSYPRIPNKPSSLTADSVQQKMANVRLEKSSGLKRRTSGNNLFSFWESGLRVHCPVSDDGRVDPVSKFIASDTEVCLQCVHALFTKRKLTSSDDSLGSAQTHSRSTVECETDPSGPEHKTSDTSPVASQDHSSMTDPATAYLRRHQGVDNASVRTAPFNVCVDSKLRCDDNTLVGARVVGSRLKDSTDSVNILAGLQSPYPPSVDTPFHLALTQALQVPGAELHLKGITDPTIIGLAPPTSPTFPETSVDPLNQNELKYIPVLTDELGGNTEPSEPRPNRSLISGKRQHAVSGSYQNVTNTMDCNPVIHRDLPLTSPTLSTQLNQSMLKAPDLPRNKEAVADAINLASHQAQHLSDALQSDTSLLGSQTSLDLDARISETMDVIRSTIETAFQTEIAGIRAENTRLSAKVDRLTAELSSLRGYEAAFHALRPFVNPEVWDQLQQQLAHGKAFSGAPTQNSLAPVQR